jgi:hypothetical protein
MKKFTVLLSVVAILIFVCLYVFIKTTPSCSVRVIITVMSVERVSQSENIFDGNKPDFFQTNTLEKIRLPNKSVCQSFAVMDESRGISQTYVFKNLCGPNGRQYWGKFKAEVELSTEPDLISSYKDMPVLVRVFKIIEPTPPE